jgi:rubrerythrin
MGEGSSEGVENRVTIETVAELAALTSRRDFLHLIGLGGALVLLPSFATSCGTDAVTGIAAPGSGETVTIDFGLGDTGILQYAFALEQLEADFYSRIVSAFAGSNLTAAEQTLLTDIRNHEVVHREVLRAALGASAAFTVTPTYSGLNLKDRASVLATAKTLEALGIAAYNGAAQYLTTADNLTLLGKIVSVEARHASAIGDLLNPKSADFAPNPFDAPISPVKVATVAQGYIVDKLAFANAPSVFVPGPGTA